ncbi:hypothetical protein [Crocosphaera watsonii]
MNTQDQHGYTALMMAQKQGYIHIVELLNTPTTNFR